MNFFHLALLNLRRHLTRTLIGAAGIILSVIAMLSVVTILQGAVRMFERILNNDSEMIVFEKNVSDLFFSNVPISSVDQLNTHEAIALADPVLFGIVSSATNPVVTCFGVHEHSPRYSKAKWIAGVKPNGSSVEKEVAIGSRAANFMKAEIGQQIKLGHGTFKVTGILETNNGFEDGGVFMPLNVCQEYFHKQGVASAATLKLKDKTKVADVKNYIETNFKNLIAQENQEFSNSYSQFKIMKTTSWLVMGIAFLLSSLSVANTMILSVFSRVRELAILRVNGFSKSQIGKLIVSESILISLFGVVTGVVLSYAMLHLLKAIPALQGYIDTSVSIPLILTVVALSLLTGIAGALYPAFYAMKIKPADALRYE